MAVAMLVIGFGFDIPALLVTSGTGRYYSVPPHGTAYRTLVRTHSVVRLDGRTAGVHQQGRSNGHTLYYRW